MFGITVILLIVLQLSLSSATVDVSSKVFWDNIHSKIISPKYKTQTNLRSMVSTDTSSSESISSLTTVETIYQLTMLYTGANCMNSPVTIIGQVSTTTGLLIPGCFDLSDGGMYQSIYSSYSIGSLPPYPYYALGTNTYSLFK